MPCRSPIRQPGPSNNQEHGPPRPDFRVTGHRSQVTGHWQFRVFLTLPRCLRISGSQATSLTGHGSQVTGHRSQVTGHGLCACTVSKFRVYRFRVSKFRGFEFQGFEFRFHRFRVFLTLPRCLRISGSRVTDHRSQVTAHWQFGVFLTLPRCLRISGSQATSLTGHGSQVTGHRSQVTGHGLCACTVSKFRVYRFRVSKFRGFEFRFPIQLIIHPGNNSSTYTIRTIIIVVPPPNLPYLPDPHTNSYFYCLHSYLDLFQ